LKGTYKEEEQQQNSSTIEKRICVTELNSTVKIPYFLTIDKLLSQLHKTKFSYTINQIF
jgi:hypothetical protein